MKGYTKITIITPSYNQAEFLEATIQSVLSQGYPNLEYIIIDGGSTDGSVEIIKKYEPFLAYWESSKDAGQYHAIQKGFEKSTGEIMAWLNSDDMYYPWTLKTVASIMTELPEIEWLTTLFGGWWDRQGFNTGFTSFPGYSKDAFLDGCYIPWSDNNLGWIQQESTFWKRSLWEKAGAKIGTQYRLAGDFDLWAKFYRHSDLFATVSALGGFRSQSTQKSASRELYISEALNSLERMRMEEKWKPSKYRNSLRNLKIQKVSKVREWLIRPVAYAGNRIVRKDTHLPSAHWSIESYRFFNDIIFRA